MHHHIGKDMPEHAFHPEGHKPDAPPIILVIENDTNNRILLEKILGLGGYHFVSAANGEEALSLLKEGQHVDLVLTDLSMPVLDGFKATQILRATSGYEALPIVAVTALAMSGDREYALSIGCNEYLTKPYRHSDLLAVVARLLKRTA
jgi:two-component system cell cycle response regulator DivK